MTDEVTTTTTHDFDVVVVGSGAGGMATALRAKSLGLSVVILEKSTLFGGSTAMSGGGVWVPNAPQLRREGVVDDQATVLRYLENIVEGTVPRERLEAYLENAPKMMEFLESQPHLSDAFFWVKGYSDYFTERGGNPEGRGLWSRPVDKRLLGDDVKLLRPGNKRMQLPLGSWMTSGDFRDLLALRWKGTRGKRMVLKLAWRVMRAKLLGERITAGGQALATRLWLSVREQSIPVWRETPMLSLLTDEDGAVVGVLASREGKRIEVRARRGVMMATGGFDHNMEMRVRYQPTITSEWSAGSRDNLGEGIIAGQAVGGAVDLMDDAWWMPSVGFPDGTLFSLLAERQYPGQFIVNGAGERFIKESTPYTAFVHAVIEGERKGVRHIPAWMIFDNRAWKRNLIAGHVPGTPLKPSWSGSGMFYKCKTLEELATRIDVPAEALVATARRYNDLAALGRDEDFHRGESPYDQYYGDPSYPNPNLAAVDTAPFYALAVVPGDLGTKGGLVTDPTGRVLRSDGSIIEGLYATGNASSSVMGPSYAGAGSTLGPTMTFGVVAAEHMASQAPE